MTHRAGLPDLNTLNPEALRALIVAQHEQLLCKNEELLSKDGQVLHKDEQLLRKDAQLASRGEEIERLELLIADELEPRPP